MVTVIKKRKKLPQETNSSYNSISVIIAVLSNHTRQGTKNRKTEKKDQKMFPEHWNRIRTSLQHV